VAVQSPELDFDQCVLLLKALLLERPLAGKSLSIGITTVSGRHIAIDSAATPIVSEERREQAALNIITNDETLAAALAGDLDPKHPDDKHFLVYGGDLEQWSALTATVATFNTLSVRTTKARR
jgi:hypothetical protein